MKEDESDCKLMAEVAIADDNERMLDLLGELLIITVNLHWSGKANNGEEMCKIIEQKQPDVVLLDLIMPKMDGLSVMEQVNADRRIKKHPNFYRRDSCRTGTYDRRCL